MTFLSCTLSPSSIANYRNIVRLIHLQYGYPNPLDNDLLEFQYSLLLRGIKRAITKAATRPKLPITPSFLKEIRKQLTFTDSFDATFWAACLVAFHSFFRKANLRRSDLHLFSWGVVMVVRWNKAIQFRQRTLLIPLPRVNESPLCPLRALANAYDLTTEAGPYDPAFMYP